LWGSEVDYDAQANDRRLAGSTSFSDIVDDLDFALPLHVEGHSGDSWGVFGDLLYLKLSNNSSLPNGARLDTESDVTIFDAGGLYTIREGIDLLFGIRSIGIDTDIGVTPPGITVSADPGFTDGLIGVRFIGELLGQWGYVFRADVSGGDSEGTWNVLAGTTLNFGEKGNKRTVFGYRHMEIETEREGNANLETDLTLSGPIVGVEFAFR
jgi:hypothetical protein